ncbi:MAG: hemolysin III family protein [Candidatus Thermoplasmatota archaeon]
MDEPHDVEVEVDPSERFSFLSHAVGALAAAAGLTVLARRADGALAVTSAVLYGASLVLLLASSSLHHAVHPRSPVGRRALRRLDHIAIFGLIAGTYTPVSLVGLGGAWGWSIFGVIWGLFVVGALTKVFWLHQPRWFSVALYIAMGWTALVAIVPLLERFSGEALSWMLAGGVAYTGGAVIYGTKRPDLWPHWLGSHGIWHVFVLVGAACHWWFVWAYVL